MTVTISIKITRQKLPPPPPIVRSQHCSPVGLLLLILFILPVLLPADTMYRYVNEQGVVVYSQTPPVGQQAEPINAVPGPSEADKQAAQQRLQQSLKNNNKSQNSASSADKKMQKYADIFAKNCTIARENLEKIEQLGDRALIMPDGKKNYPSAAEREALITQTQQQINDNCK
ncbi:DUF4124 domain-containing protein [Rhodoferax sp. 4810]|uniref:DUF4124 domain-containing protein n=2 Tax=Thiospirillum jenense TaxID=1653858 RepID=A0A839H8C4_9GAMM|nr:DUF4124 domain-containing protein [Rhodoferax jenense]MBB1124870.1 DUF4124 domain-containing protein [Thiospirillum jenense]